MKDWFPFTLFDFFSYVACGLTVLCAADYAYPGSNYLMKEKWSAFQGALGLSLAYVCGQLLAIPSSILLEHMIARKLLRPPAVVLLSNRSLKKEKILNFLIGRHYASLPESIRDLVFRNASEATGQTVEMLKENLEAVFVPALLYSRQNERIATNATGINGRAFKLLNDHSNKSKDTEFFNSSKLHTEMKRHVIK